MAAGVVCVWVRPRMTAVALCMIAVASIHAQAPAFDVVSIKRNTSGQEIVTMQPSPGGLLSITNAPIRLVIRAAYNLQEYELSGGPGWLETERYDITARAEGNPPQQQMVAMVRTLLEDRFRLRLREEQREGTVYALVLARADGSPGPRLRPAQPCFRAPMTGPAQQPPPGAPSPCGFRAMPGSLEGRGVTLAALTFGLAGRVGRPVVDRTGREGEFDLDLTYAPDAGIDSGVSIFTALQEQLGLKLDSSRGPVKVFEIDAIERPTEN